MTEGVKQLLRSNGYLVYYNYANISDRLLEATDNELFVAFNRKRSTYEIHSVKKFRTHKHCRSIEGTWMEQKYLNGWLITDIGCRDTRRFGNELADQVEYSDIVMDEHEERSEFKFIEGGFNEIKRMLGGM